MSISNIKHEKAKVHITVDMDKTQWKKIINKVVQKHAKNVKIDGFRKGKLPPDQAKKFLNMQNVLLDAANVAVNESSIEVDKNEKIQALNVEVYPTPAIDIKQISENELIYDVIYFEIPKIEISDYKNLDVKLNIPTVTDQEVEREINMMLEREKMLKPKKDGVIALGDQAVFDFVGTIDGKEFPGGKADNFKLEIGSKRFIPGFEDGMVGMKIGEEKDINLCFPKDYHAKEIAGKPVVFKVKVHEINEISKPKLDDAFVKSLNFKDVLTVEQLKKFIYDSILSVKKQQANQENVVAINKAIFNKAKYGELPEVMINDEYDKIYQQYLQQLQQMKIKEDDFLKMVNKTKKIIQDEIRLQAKSNVVVYGALDYIVDKEKVKIEKQEVDERYKVLAQTYNKKIDDIKKSIDEETLTDVLLHEKVILDLIEWNSKNTVNASKKTSSTTKQENNKSKKVKSTASKK